MRRTRKHRRGTWLVERSRNRRTAFDPASVAWHTWLRADTEVYEDTGTDAAEDGDEVQKWGDKSGNGHTFEQTTATTMPLFDAENAGLNGEPSITWDDSNDELNSTEASSVWKFIHDGTGMTAVTVFKYVGTGGILWDSLRLTASRIGAYIKVTSGGDVTFKAGNGTGTFLVDDTTAGSLVSAGAHILIVRMKTGATDEYDIRLDGTSIASGAFTGAASSSNPHHAMVLGNHDSGSDCWDGDIAEQGFCDSLLTVATCEQIEAYAASRYGPWAA